MTDIALFVVLTALMGLSIFLSFPLILSPRARGRFALLLTAAAIGILVFLLADIFGDVAILLTASQLYLTVPYLDLVFVVGFTGTFLLLFWIEHGPPARGSRGPTFLALLIAIGMGAQNLTEGLVFGAAWAAGLLGLLTVVFVGFVLQNTTEGFPIAAPYLGVARPPARTLVGLYLIGGLPTLVGGFIGYLYNSPTLDVVFDAVALGAIAYVVLPMIRGAFRAAAPGENQPARYSLVYLGFLLGFIVGFAVNAV